MSEKHRDNLIQFILKTHKYRGEGHGVPIERPYLKRKWSDRPILNPESFEIVLQGMNLGLEYMIMNELHDQCPFLIKGKVCQIHDSKPWNCTLFPHDQEHRLRTDNKILEICKGI